MDEIEANNSLCCNPAVAENSISGRSSITSRGLYGVSKK